MADQDKHFLDKLTPKQRQFLTLGGIAFLLFGVLWAVFSITDTPKQPGTQASAAVAPRNARRDGRGGVVDAWARRAPPAELAVMRPSLAPRAAIRTVKWANGRQRRPDTSPLRDIRMRAEPTTRRGGADYSRPVQWTRRRSSHRTRRSRL